MFFMITMNMWNESSMCTQIHGVTEKDVLVRYFCGNCKENEEKKNIDALKPSEIPAHSLSEYRCNSALPLMKSLEACQMNQGLMTMSHMYSTYKQTSGVFYEPCLTLCKRYVTLVIL